MSEAFKRLVDATKRTEPGRGQFEKPDPSTPAQIKFKAIPNVPTERLQRSLEFYHGMTHTPEGLHEFSESRRSLVEQGLRTRAIATELRNRGETPGSCPHCWGS